MFVCSRCNRRPVLYKAQVNLRELNMLKVTTTSSIEATVSPETKFNVQLKQTSLADEFTCAIMRWRIHAKKISQGGSGLGNDIDRAMVGRATNGDGGVHDQTVRPSGREEERGREREGVT